MIYQHKAFLGLLFDFFLHLFLFKANQRTPKESDGLSCTQHDPGRLGVLSWGSEDSWRDPEGCHEVSGGNPAF